MEGNRNRRDVSRNCKSRNQSRNHKTYHYSKCKNDTTIQSKRRTTYQSPIRNRQQLNTSKIDNTKITIEQSLLTQLLQQIEQLKLKVSKGIEKISIEKQKTKRLRNKNKRLRNKYNKLMNSVLINNLPVIRGRVVLPNNNQDEEEDEDDNYPYNDEYTINNENDDESFYSTSVIQPNDEEDFHSIRVITNQLNNYNNSLYSPLSPIRPLRQNENVNVIYNSESNKEKLNKYPILIYGKLRKPINNKCTICLEKFIKYDELRKIKCRHLFHIECIDKWIERRNACPLCNEVLV